MNVRVNFLDHEHPKERERGRERKKTIQKWNTDTNQSADQNGHVPLLFTSKQISILFCSDCDLDHIVISNMNLKSNLKSDINEIWSQHQFHVEVTIHSG